MSRIHKDTVLQFARFFVVGVSNTAVDFSIYIVLTRLVPFFGIHIYVANIISFICAASWSYFANRTWTFKQTSRVNVGEATKFYTSTVTSFIFNMATLFIAVHILGVYDLIGKLLASAVSMVSNYLLNKFWVFKSK